MTRQRSILIVSFLAVMLGWAILPLQLTEFTKAPSDGSPSISIASEAYAIGGWHDANMKRPGGPCPKNSPSGIPEPTTGALLGLGIVSVGLLAGVSKRKKKDE